MIGRKMIGKNKMIISARADGLGERFLSLFNALYLSKVTGLKFGYMWLSNFSYVQSDLCSNGIRRNEGMDIEHDVNLFSSDFIQNFKIKNDSLLNDDGTVFTHSPGSFVCCKTYSLDIFKGDSEYQWGWSSTSFDLSRLFNEIDCEDYYDYNYNIFNNFSKNFSSEIREAMLFANTIANSKLNNNFISIHVRCGGIVYEHRTEAIYGYKKAVPVHMVIDLIKQFGSEVNIVLFGDDILTLRQIVLFLNNPKNIYVADDFIKDLNYNSSQITFFDIVLMSKSNQIFSSGKSALSILASRISGKKNDINISIYKYIDKYDQYNTINRYLNILDVHKLQKSFSLFYIYTLSKELNFDISITKKYIKDAIILDPDNIYYKIKFLHILLIEKKYAEADNYLGNLLNQNSGLFFNLFFYKKHEVLGFCFMNYEVFNAFYDIPKEFLTDNFILMCFNIYKEIIDIDISKIVYGYEELKIIIDFKYNIFLDKVLNFYQYKNCIKIFNQKYPTLSYKIGYLFLNKNLKFSFIKKIFFLISIINFHKENNKIFLDYFNNQNFNDRYFKFGQSLIKAHKSWHKGGYVKLFFKICKLKKG
ncbi:TPA: hypothetical protein R1613_000346 [Campylobacter jejuni]|nr:hypothetical protein [Campylobacter jejuni]HEC1692814.1 hypothetical protein [Campylobacter jejuni]